MKKPRLLWVGDAVVSTGFARATHYILDTLKETWEVVVLGMNAPGDPHPYPYPIFRAAAGGDHFGVNRIGELARVVKPDLIVIQQDPWNFEVYHDALRSAKVDVPVVGAVAVDGLNCRGTALNELAGAVFWTQFGLDQARLGGYVGPATVIPLGVDRKIYRPIGKRTARQQLQIIAADGSEVDLTDVFVVGNVNRNQPRKRLDLTIKFFSEWVRTSKIDNAYLYLHVCPTGETGYDIRDLMRYYGVKDRLILLEPEIGYGISEEGLAHTYAAFDVSVTTTQGEGFGLTTLEAMACKIPVIAPDWAALGDWPKSSICKVPCTAETAATTGGINVIGGVPNRVDYLKALDLVYNSATFRRRLADDGFARATSPEFRWTDVGAAYAAFLPQFVRGERHQAASTEVTTVAV